MIGRSCLIATMLALVFAAAPSPAHARPTDAQVRDGIKKLVDRIYAAQNAGGIWDPEKPTEGNHEFGVNYGGTTALFTYALLTAGESYQSPKLQRAIEFLRKQAESPDKSDMKGVYAIGLRAHVWAHLPPQFEKYLKDDMYWLSRAAHDDGKGGMGFHYTAQMKTWDNSVTQYGALGLWEAAKRGDQVNGGIWQGLEKHFIDTQHEDGGWSYSLSAARAESTGSMSAAGLAVLYITQDYLHSGDFRTPGAAKKHKLQDHINRGLDWFGKNFAPDKNPGMGSQTNYYLYGVERVGLASGLKYFNGKDWYSEGADYIIKHPAGGPDMAFQLLFLVRGRVPVLVNKLSVPDINWNNRPRDIARLTEWVSDEVENGMNWQIVDISGTPEDWLDAPLLYLASHDELNFTDEQAKKIRRFIDLGGMLITTADASSYKFNKSVEKLAEKLFPGNRFAPLKDDDTLLNIVFQIRPDRNKIQSLNNGIRHVWIHLPTDVSWTLHSSTHTDATPWELFVNTYYYATEKGRARPRLDTVFVKRTTTGGGPKVTVGRAKYDGNWDPEPLAWEVQSNTIFNAKKADVQLKDVDLSDLPSPSEVPLVHVVGTAPTEFSAAQTASIKKYADAGGVILFENAGGKGTFADSVIKMLNATFPGKRVKPLSSQSPLITGKGIGGEDCSHVAYRTYAILRMGEVNRARLMELASDDGNPRILLSAEDMTGAMLDRPVWGVFGYDTESARNLMTNVVLYANSHKK